MRIGRNKRPKDLQGSGSAVESIAGASRLSKLPRSTSSHRKVPPTYASTTGASHDPNLYYQVQDEDGTVKTYFETHPLGNRKQRRYRRRHDPRYTKESTGGRDWQALQKSRQEKQFDE